MGFVLRNKVYLTYKNAGVLFWPLSLSVTNGLVATFAGCLSSRANSEKSLLFFSNELQI